MDNAVVRWSGIGIALFALFAAPGRGGAAEPEAAGQEASGYRLSLTQALRIALENNLDLIVARKEPRIAAQDVFAREAAFDMSFEASAGTTRSDTDRTFKDNLGGGSTEGSTRADGLNAAVSWGQKVRFGASYSVSLSTARTDTSFVDLDQRIGFLSQGDVNPRNSAVRFDYSMPLLRGFGREVNTADVLLARNRLGLAQEDLRLRAHEVLQRVENAYWDLIAARRALEVARESLKLAQDLLDLNRKKVEVGTLAPIEITQAEAGVASREEGVIVAEAAVANAEDNLRRLLGIPPGDPLWNVPLVPTDSPSFAEKQVDLEEAIARALERRPELFAARRQMDDARLRKRVALNSTRHGLELNVSLERPVSDQDLRVDILSPPGAPPTDQTTDASGLNWRVGVAYTYPIGNRAAKANYAAAALNLEKAEASYRNVEQAVRVDVRAAVRNVESGIKRVQAARANTVLQRKTLEAEQRKFENGMSTSFEVLRIQTDLSNAQLAEIRAVLDYMKALADLERAQGTLLEARGLELGAEGR
jgi:outer membrane protein TolC